MSEKLTQILDKLLEINGIVNGIVWGPPMLILIVGTGLILTIGLGFIQLRKFSYVMKNTLFKMFEKQQRGEGEVTPFQALATALAATVGTGNIAGVATAIATGGPGAVFWMLVSAFVGMATKFGEVVLAVHFRERKPDGSFAGGPMYYLEKGLKIKVLAVLFALFGAIAAFGIGNMVQANSVAASLDATFGIPKLYTGIALAMMTALVILGGLKRLATVTEKLVPFMAAFYIVGSVIILLLNISRLPSAIAMIISQAFTGSAAIGGFAGSTVMMAMKYGVARGVFSNEAGLGSAPIAHAAATTDHPVRQGLWGIFEVFMDTIVICSLTSFTILTTGVWTQVDATGKQLTGAALTTAAFNQGLPGVGGIIVAIGILLFAYSTLLSWSYYGEKCIEYLFGVGAKIIYRIIFIPFVVIGAIGGLEELWHLADTLNGLMAVPNLIGLLGLSGTIFKLTREFFEKEGA
ncbi:alanine/glycine:cation symporter family protein [Thermosediminibacter oceani]|uniref:Amino acid carrier protein n=1 Tax=Thermosediminibacter oceani (strain ATCC BAA-1034 / DSM 16646 / JW/IW-1228P) TaxID=555079 RepID=D9RXX9_THEOJ|nr:sodium:alanine symporter family protein [Thermosediminibacter oceani]ADL08203.1 amino acid carrier protein [Thermosediminibacter oceani DSM 16646]